MADMSPEELAALFHGPEATTGPEARRQCMVCGKPQGQWGFSDNLNRGFCDKCEQRQARVLADAARAEQRRLRLAHFSPEQLASEEERARAQAAADESHRRARSEHDRLADAKRARDDEFHREVTRQAEAREQREHQERMSWFSASRQPAPPAARPGPPARLAPAPFLPNFWIGFLAGAVCAGVCLAARDWWRATKAKAPTHKVA